MSEQAGAATAQETMSPMEAALAAESANDNYEDLDWDNLEEVTTSIDNFHNADEASESKAEDGEESEGSEKEEDVEAKDADKEEKDDSEAESEEKEAKEEKVDEVEVKVNGKIEKVSLEELKQNYSGKVAYDKKFSELDVKIKSYEKEIAEVNEYVSELGRTMKNASMLEGVYKIGELNNIGPHQIKQALIAELMPEINRLSDLSEDQVELEFSKADLEYQRQLQEKQAAEFKKQQAQAELQSRIGKVMTSINIAADEWDAAVKHLDETLPKNEELTPELVGEYVQFSRAERRAGDMLSSFEGGKYLSDSKTVSELQSIIMDNPDFTDQDIKEILESALGSAKQDAAEKEVEKVAKKSAKKVEAAKIEDPMSLEEQDFDSWDDIE